MAKTYEELIKEFEGFIPFVKSLQEHNERHWNVPIAEGKWTVKDIISHIMLWDKYFYEEAIHKIKLQQPLTLRQLNFSEFNANAIEYAKSQTMESIVEQCVLYRSKLIQDISGLSEEEYEREYKDADNRPFSVHSYLHDFIYHDNHHRNQIEQFLVSTL